MLFEPSLPLIQRYQLDTSKYGSHLKIIEKVTKFVPPRKSKVLDIGCASGYLGSVLIKKGYKVYGVDVDPRAVKAAKSKGYEEVLVLDIESCEKYARFRRYFDAIICADILEHLRRPDKVLLMLKEYLKPGGFLIASIPNMAYWKIRLKLMLGKFEYEEHGILDKTHLRFFTLKTGKQLFERSGFRVIEIDYTGFLAYAPLLRFFPTLFAYQFIYVALPY